MWLKGFFSQVGHFLALWKKCGQARPWSHSPAVTGSVVSGSRAPGPGICGDGCRSLFLGLWRIWTWVIREHLPIFSFHTYPKVCGACMLERKVISSHYREANPALVPWEIARLWLIPQILKLTSFRQPWSPQIISYFWTEVIMNLICVRPWNKIKQPRCITLRKMMCLEQPWVWCSLRAVYRWALVPQFLVLYKGEVMYFLLPAMWRWNEIICGNHPAHDGCSSISLLGRSLLG